MESLQSRKRRNADDTLQDNHPAKRIKHTAVRSASKFPPNFWDSLSKIWLTPRALRELDRRNKAQLVATTSAASVDVTSTSLAKFATRGGPDLRHVRGYVARINSSYSLASSSRPTQSTKAISVSSKSRRSSVYDKDFEQHLVDNRIYPKGYEYPDDDSIPEPRNLDDIVQALQAPRASLSPSRFPRSAFKAFTLANDRVVSNGKVLSDILPTIRGNTNILSEGNLPFTNLDLITNGTTVIAVPDMYDGSCPKTVHKIVRQELTKAITPTSHGGRPPLAPNFFVQAKAPRGGADVAKRQACLDGAVGARAMHSLQNYGEEEPVFDGDAHTFSSTYHDGTLNMYVHHITGPAAEGEPPEYHMTQIDGWQMTGNIDSFRRGATAFRNARDVARRQRETFIQAANTRASQAGLVAPMEDGGEIHQDNNPNGPTNRLEAWQSSHDVLQQQIAQSYVEDGDSDGGEAPSTPQCLYTLDSILWKTHKI